MPKKNPPILAAAFADENQLWRAVTILQGHKIGRDFIGAFIGEIGGEMAYAVSVLVPSRLRKEASDVFQECAAVKIGSVAEMKSLYGLRVPHPGVIDDHDMKLPMGDEYPANRNRKNPPGNAGVKTMPSSSR